MSVIEHPPTLAQPRMNRTLKWVLIGVGVMLVLPFVATIGLVVLLAVIAAVGGQANESFTEVSAKIHSTPVSVPAFEIIPDYKNQLRQVPTADMNAGTSGDAAGF